MKATTAKEVLVAAHWILTHYEWCQHVSLITKDGSRWYNPISILSEPNLLRSCCLFGAIDLVDTNLTIRDEAIDLLLNVIGYDSLPAWNDKPGRTKRQVLTQLTKAIEKA